MRKNKETSIKIILCSVGFCILLPNQSFAALTPQQENQIFGVGSGAGSQMNKTLDLLERVRIANQIEKDIERNKKESSEKKTDVNTQKSKSDLSVKLTQITCNPSDVIPQATLDSIFKEYVNKDVRIADLYEIVERINKLYANGGYATCKAFLPQQEIENGVLRITLIEGKVGNIKVVGNRITKGKYITNRMDIEQNKIASMKVLDKKITSFNATNSTQVQLMLQASDKPGCTDFVLQAYEPNRINHTVFADNSGSYTSGQYRYGYFMNIHDIMGKCDNLSLGTTRTMGTRGFSSSYEFPIGSTGTKLTLGYNSNATRIIRGNLYDAGLTVKGHSTAYTAALRQPCVVNRKTRSEFGLEYTNQTSNTTMEGDHWVDDKIYDLLPYFSHTSYGDSHVYFQKISYSAFGKYTCIDGSIDTDSMHYLKYNGYYQKAYKHGQVLAGRLDVQYVFSDFLPSSRQFFIGGNGTVRGYRESLLSGERGWSSSLEYQVPLNDRRHNFFTFFDCGRTGGQNAFESHQLRSTGFGIKNNWSKHIYSTLTIGFPLIHNITGSEVPKTRIHYMISGSF